LIRLPRIKSSQRKRKRLIFLSRIAVNRATINIAVITTATIIKVTDAIAMIANLTIIIKRNDATIALDVTTRTQKAPGPTTRRMTASMITPRKRATRPCIMTSPLSQAPAICPEKGVDLVQDLLCALDLGLALAQAAGATTTIMSTKMTAGRIHPSSVGTCTPQRVTMVDAFIVLTKALLSLPPSPLRRQRRSSPRNRELCQ
jgi:hypothetical protein